MFDPTSRYFRLETATLTVIDRDSTVKQIAYVRRRFVPQPSSGSTEVTHVFTEGERLDQIADRYLGDPTAFFLLCDENRALHPDELTAEIGRELRVPSPRF